MSAHRPRLRVEMELNSRLRHSDVTKRFERQISEILGSEDHLVEGKGIRPYHHRLFASSKVGTCSSGPTDFRADLSATGSGGRTSGCWVSTGAFRARTCSCVWSSRRVRHLLTRSHVAGLFANRALWDLKWKARIYVEQGVNLLGELSRCASHLENSCSLPERQASSIDRKSVV